MSKPCYSGQSDLWLVILYIDNDGGTHVIIDKLHLKQEILDDNPTYHI